MLSEESKKVDAYKKENCETCSSQNLLRKEKGIYYFQGQAYSKNNWYRKMANYLNFSNDEVSLRRMPDEIRIEYIRSFVLKNIKKTTFFTYILTCVLFFALSLTLFLFLRIYEGEPNLMNVNQFIFLKFLSFMFFLFGVILLIKLIILQEKVIMRGSTKRVKYIHITKKQYQGVLDVFKKK